MISEKDLQKISTPLKEEITCIRHEMDSGYLKTNIEFDIEVEIEGKKYHWLVMLSLNFQTIMLHSVFLPMIIKAVQRPAFRTSTRGSLIKKFPKLLLNNAKLVNPTVKPPA